MELSGQPHTLADPLDRKLGWPQSQSGYGGEEKKFHSLPLPGIKP